MMRTSVVALAVFLSVAGSAGAQTSTLMGSVSFPDVKLTRTAVLEVTLEDVAAPAGKNTIASSRITQPESPVMFSLPYDAARVVPAGHYAVRARIVDGATTVFTEVKPARVLTQGNGSFFNLSLTKPEAPGAATAPPGQSAPPPAPRAAPPVATPPAPEARSPAPKPAPPPPPKSIKAPAVKPTTTPNIEKATPPTSPAKSAPARTVEKASATSPAAKPAPPPAPTVTAASDITRIASTAPVTMPATAARSATPASTKPAVVEKPAATKPAAANPPAALKSAPMIAAPAAPIASLPATFTGTLPCPDCRAIRYELTLAADATYAVKKTFEGPNEQVQLEAGAWDYSSDRAVLVLKSTHDAWSYFAVRPDGVLRAVDARGDSLGRRAPADLMRSGVVNSSVATISNIARPSGPVTVDLSGTAWTLSELENRPVRPPSDERRAIVIAFDAATNKFTGASGCNVLEGTFTATWRTLTVTPDSALKICRIDQGTERALSRALKATRTYRITGTFMDWFDEKGNRVARFTGVPRK